MAVRAPSPPVEHASIPVRVRSLRDEAREIRSFEFEALSGRTLPAWTPGAHILVQPPGGSARAYSLCSLPGETATYRIAVRHDGAAGGAPARLHALHPGDRLTVSVPHSSFGLDEQAEQHLLIAGGIGIAPLLSMFRALERGGETAALHYFARSEEDAAFLAELEGARIRGTLHCHFGLNAAATAARLQNVFASAVALTQAVDGLTVYTCGPAGLMAAVSDAAIANRLALDNVRQQYFGPVPNAEPLPPLRQAGRNRPEMRRGLG